jgi:Predicted dioxygenase
LFYPGDFEELRSDVRSYLYEGMYKKNIFVQKYIDFSHVKALIVPHAGYIYSGQIAACAYRLLLQNRKKFKRILILGPAHRVWINGAALPSSEIFETPLGKIKLDQKLMKKIVRNFPWISVNEEAHSEEHCIEVQLPFLQETLDDFVLIPLVVGETKTEQIAELIYQFTEDEETLIVISTDLSHFYDYDTAKRNDLCTANAIESLELDKIYSENACGAQSLRGFLSVAKKKDWEVLRLGMCNSGDTSGDRDRVVGYGAWAFK